MRAAAGRESACNAGGAAESSYGAETGAQAGGRAGRGPGEGCGIRAAAGRDAGVLTPGGQRSSLHGGVRGTADGGDVVRSHRSGRRRDALRWRRHPSQSLPRVARGIAARARPCRWCWEKDRNAGAVHQGTRQRQVVQHARVVPDAARLPSAVPGAASEAGLWAVASVAEPSKRRRAARRCPRSGVWGLSRLPVSHTSLPLTGAADAAPLPGGATGWPPRRGRRAYGAPHVRE